MQVRPMTAEDWSSVSQIYKEGIDTQIATFETQVPSYEHWDKAHLSKNRWVATENDTILGWVALSPVSSRCVYGGVAEVSVYIARDARKKGVGQLLLHTLIDQSEKDGYWTLQSGIFPENKGSIKLHEKAGFRYIGKREKIGMLHGEWKDNVLYERRSAKVGV